MQRDIWHGPEAPGTAGRPWDLGPEPSRAGEFVDTAGPRAPARVAQYRWSNPRALGPGPESPGTAGRPRGPSDSRVSPWHSCSTPRHSGTVSSRPGQLVNTEGFRTRAPGARDCWLTPRAIRTGPESRGPAGGPRGPLDPGQYRPGHMVDPTGRRTRVRSPGTPGRTHVPSDTGPSAWDSWSTTRAFRLGPESTWTAGRPGGPSDAGPSPPGQPVDTACPWTRARVPRDRWATLWDLRPGPEFPGKAG